MASNTKPLKFTGMGRSRPSRHNAYPNGEAMLLEKFEFEDEAGQKFWWNLVDVKRTRESGIITEEVCRSLVPGDVVLGFELVEYQFYLKASKDVKKAGYKVKSLK